MRHGEVDNPGDVLYGRLPGFQLTKRGHNMARQAAAELERAARPVSALIVSPLQRTRQSADPIGRAFNLQARVDERIIEPHNYFEGKAHSARRNPCHWHKLWNPWRPSWGEPYASIAARIRQAMDDAWVLPGEGDVVLVSHQSPIWMAHLSIAGTALAHNPAARRCELSSITSFQKNGETWREISYRTPAGHLRVEAEDKGAV